MTAHDRFWAKVRKEPEDGCWLWTAALFVCGYGHFYAGNGRYTAAHRFSLEEFLGRRLLPGMRALHRCDVNYPRGDLTYRRCVNPAHLFEGTQRDNILDMIRKGRGNLQAGAQRGERNPRAKLTLADVAAVRALAAAGVFQKDIGTRFGITQGVVSKIVRHDIWK